MKSLYRFFARLSNLAAGSRADQRLREEMEEHLAQQTCIARVVLDEKNLERLFIHKRISPNNQRLQQFRNWCRPKG